MLTPTQTKALSILDKQGSIVRYNGGYWSVPCIGLGQSLEKYGCVSTGTIKALERMEVIIPTKFQHNENGRFAVEYRRNKSGGVSALEKLFADHGQFVAEKFPTITDFRALLNHMIEEVGECGECGETGDPEKFADILLLLFSSFRLRFPGEPVGRLLEFAFDKLEKLAGREWKEPNDRGFQEHVRTPNPGWKPGNLKGVFKFDTGFMRMVLIKDHIHYPGEYRLNVREIGFDCVLVSSTSEADDKEAKLIAEDMVRKYLRKMSSSIA